MAEESTQTQTSQTDPNAGTGDPPETPARPEHVPEKFWDAEKGAVRVDDVLGAYSKLEGERGKQWDDLKPQVKAEIEGEMFANRPGSPDDYKPVLPDDSNIVLLDEAPGEDFEPEEGKTYMVMKADDPLWQTAREVFHQAGKSNDEFSEAVGLFAQSMAERTPTAQEREDARNKEIEETLGEHGQARVDHVLNALNSTLGEDHRAAIDALPVASVPALEALLEKAGQPRFAAPASGQAAEHLTEEQLRAIQAEPDYWDNPEKQKKVREGWQRLYPGKK